MRRRRVYLTSFFKARELPENVEVYSAAVYQPKGFDFPKADWCDIRDEDGNWIRPREFLTEPDPAAAYYQAMLDHYWERRKEIGQWLADTEYTDVALCCWCPFDRAAKRQLEEFGSFICHTGPIGTFLDQYFGDTDEVVLDKDREVMYNYSEEANSGRS